MPNTIDPAPNETTGKTEESKLTFGDACFPEQSISSIEFTNRREGNLGVRSASVHVIPPPELRWDYSAQTTLHGNGQLFLTGVCVKATENAEGSIDFELRCPFWQLEQTLLNSIETFGMSGEENLYWLVKLADQTQDVVIPDLVLDTEMRPFLYAIPLEGMSSSGAKSLLVGDSGIASHEYDCRPSAKMGQERG